MPLYVYECRECSGMFEIFQGIGERRLLTCPSCGKRKLRRVPSWRGSIHFRGEGFHTTDYEHKKWK